MTPAMTLDALALMSLCLNVVILREMNAVCQLDGVELMDMIHVRVISTTQIPIVISLPSLMINATRSRLVSMDRDGALLNLFIFSNGTLLI